MKFLLQTKDNVYLNKMYNNNRPTCRSFIISTIRWEPLQCYICEYLYSLLQWPTCGNNSQLATPDIDGHVSLFTYSTEGLVLLMLLLSTDTLFHFQIKRPWLVRSIVNFLCVGSKTIFRGDKLSTTTIHISTDNSTTTSSVEFYPRLKSNHST